MLHQPDNNFGGNKTVLDRCLHSQLDVDILRAHCQGYAGEYGFLPDMKYFQNKRNSHLPVPKKGHLDSANLARKVVRKLTIFFGDWGPL